MTIVGAPPDGVTLIGAHVADKYSEILIKDWPQAFPASTKILYVQAYVSGLPKDAEAILNVESPAGPPSIEVDLPKGWSGIPAGHYTDGKYTVITFAEYFTDGGATVVSFHFRPKDGGFVPGSYKGHLFFNGLNAKKWIVELNWSVSDK